MGCTVGQLGKYLKAEKKAEDERGTEAEEEGQVAIRATGVSRAAFGVIESFAGTTKPYV